MVVQIVIADRKSSDSKNFEAISELRLIEEDLLSKNIIISENELDFTRSGGFCAWRERIESIDEKNEANAQTEKCETNAETENSENETDSENSDRSERSESESSSLR